MIQSKIFFAVKCDCCGDLYEGEDYSYWPTAGDVESYAQDGDWITHEGGHVCPDCYEIGDDDEIVLLKPFIKPEIEKPKTDLQRFKELFDSVGICNAFDTIPNRLFVDSGDHQVEFIFDGMGRFSRVKTNH